MRECPLICRVILVYYKLRLEKRSVNGETFDAVRVFHSNIRNDYGMPPGVGFGWYTIDRTDSVTGFKRVFKVGSVRPNE